MNHDIAVFIREYFARFFIIRTGDRVCFTRDSVSDVTVINLFAQAVKEEGASVRILDCAFSEPYRSAPDQFHSEILRSTHWIDFTDQMAVHSPVCKNFVKQGGCFLLLPGLSRRHLDLALVSQSIDEVIKNTRIISSKFRKLGKLNIKSSAGTDVAVSLMDQRISFSRVSELMREKGKEVMFYGYALIPISFDDMSGTLVETDYVWPPNSVRMVTEPIRIEIKNGYITDIRGGKQAGELSAWFEKFNDRYVYRITHLTLGILTNMELTDSLLMNERIKGALTFGFGNVWSGEASTHTDIVVMNSQIFLNGELVPGIE